MVFRNKLKSHWASQGKKCRRGDHINPLTPGAFCQKCVFWTFWWFLGWISAKLAYICSENALASRQLGFLATSIAFYDILTRSCAEIKILCIPRAPFGRLLWSGHHWKDLLFLQKLSIDDANLVKSDDVRSDDRSGRMAKARHGQLGPAWESMG